MGDPVLTTMTIEQAKQKQFRVDSSDCGGIYGAGVFSQGDVGVVPGPADQCKRTKWSGCWPAFSVRKPAPSYAGPEQGRYGRVKRPR